MSKTLIILVAVLISGAACLFYLIKTVPISPSLPRGEPSYCRNRCGDGTCQTVTCLAVGCPCPENKESCPTDCNGNNNVSDLMACQTAADCACGVRLGTTGYCFYGNKKYVNTSEQCPDFCSGIDGKMRIKCVNNTCTQTRE